MQRRQWQPTPVFLPGKSHGQRSLVGFSPWGAKESHMTERLHFHFSLSRTRGGNGNPLQCSCLENPRDRGAWWAAIYGVTQSRSRPTGLAAAAAAAGYMPRSGVVESYGSFILSFSRNLNTVLHSGCINLHFYKQYKKIAFSPHPLQDLLFADFLMYDWYELIPHCSFYLHFSNTEQCWISFNVCLSYLYVFGEIFLLEFCPRFDWVAFVCLFVCLFLYWAA